MTLAIVAIVLVSCGGNQQTDGDKKADENVKEAEKLAMINPDEFDVVAEKYVGKEIQMEGTIVHVCQHGGKRMFIFGEDSDNRVKITTGEGMAAFNTEWEGSDVVVIGLVDEFRVDEEYLQSWQNEIEEKIASGDTEHREEDEGLHTGEDGHQEYTPEDELGQIEDLRNEIAESGTDHLSYYSIICKSYEVKEIATDDTEDEESEEAEGSTASEE